MTSRNVFREESNLPHRAYCFSIALNVNHTSVLCLDRAKIAWQFQSRDLSPALQSRDCSRAMQVRLAFTRYEFAGEGTKRNRTFNIAFTCGTAAGLSVRQLTHDLHVHLFASARECTVPLSRAQHPISRGTRVVAECACAHAHARTCLNGLLGISRCLRASVRRIYRVSMPTLARCCCIALLQPRISWKAPFASKG